MNNPKVATIGEVQNIISQRAHLEYLEKQLPKEKALELAKRIRPVASKDENGRLSIYNEPKPLKYWLDGGKIYNQSYTFIANNEVYAKTSSLKPIAKITTYHRCGYPLFIKPSVYEVLYQIPEELRDKVVAFELYASSPYVWDVYNDDLERHALTCILYTGKMPKKVKDKPVEW